MQDCDPELLPLLKGNAPFKITTETEIETCRKRADMTNAQCVVDEYHGRYNDAKLEHSELSIEQDGIRMIISIFRPSGEDPSNGRPCVYYIHGGGFIVGNRFTGISTIFSIIHDFGAICVSVEYRLAPEHPAPAALDDCHRGLVEIWKQRKLLNINPDQLVVIGRSAGACLAVGVTLLLRDSNEKEKPQICGQILSFPMLDNKSNSESCKKFQNSVAWSLDNNTLAWKYYLGGRGEQVSTVPGTARIEDLINLQPILLDIGKADILYDEGCVFDDKLRRAGIQVTAKKWKGYHCFDGGAGRKTKIGQEIDASRLKWIKKCWSK